MMNRLERMQLSLPGLSVGDALGETFFEPQASIRMAKRQVPPGPWPFTDDTEMALSVVETLRRQGQIDPDVLARGFAQRYNPRRGYGLGAHRLLQLFQQGADWRIEARRLFNGSGSYGNGAAMRVAPVGAYFADDLGAARENAILSAQPTHAHPEGIAGAVAVAIAAALAFLVGEGEKQSLREFLGHVVEWMPESLTRRGVAEASILPLSTPSEEVASQLGSGEKVSAQDTVPFALWCAARHLDDYEEAFWATVTGLGDRDTTCAIVGGITALSARRRGIPLTWLQAREPLPDELE